MQGGNGGWGVVNIKFLDTKPELVLSFVPEI